MDRSKEWMAEHGELERYEKVYARLRAAFGRAPTHQEVTNAMDDDVIESFTKAIKDD
jgi:hypothetical protein